MNGQVEDVEEGGEDENKGRGGGCYYIKILPIVGVETPFDVLPQGEERCDLLGRYDCLHLVCLDRC